jgi:CheY-like chemotaxis protein
MGTQPFQILIVEDNPADVALVREALKHQVECVLQVVADGEKALGVIDNLDADSGAPGADLLILDMHLPMHGGEDILKRLRATRHHRQIAVIAMSGQFGPELVAQEGVVCFSKPSTLDEFLRLGAIVSGLLQQKSLAEAHSSEGVQ